jgi:hypothetical protein
MRPYLKLSLLGVMIALITLGITNTYSVALAQEEVPSSAEVMAPGTEPIIECKWELPDMQSGVVGAEFPDPMIQYGLANDPHVHDDDMEVRPSVDPACTGPEFGELPSQPQGVQHMIQVLPNADDSPEEVWVQLWLSVDHPNGLSNIDDVFWKIYHPDGEFKTQVHGNRIGSNPATRIQECAALGSSNAVGTMFEAAVHTGQVSAASVDDVNLGMIAKCQQNEKAIYYSKFEISKEQPCGEYIVEGYAVSDGSIAVATNYIDVICFWQLEIDFENVNWGTISPGNMKVVSGDLIFGTANNPTVMNTGNHGMGVDVVFTELVQQGVQGPKKIQGFDACFGTHPNDLECFGEDPANAVVANPVATVRFGPDDSGDPRPRERSSSNDSGLVEPQILCSNQVGKLDLSIHPPESVPTGVYSGNVQIVARDVHSICWTDQEIH